MTAPLMWDGPKAVYRVDFDEDTRYTPFDNIDVDDQRVSVALYGFVHQDFWAKAIGVDPESGCTTYKLLPMDRG